MKSKRLIVVFGIVFICLGAALFVFRDSILNSLGASLINAGPPRKADIAVVLAGDYRGYRIVAAARLCQEGYIPKVLVSGPGGVYGHFQSDFEIEFAVKHGYPADKFVGFHENADSTLAEARAMIPELRRLGVHKYLLVTSSWHTARAGRIFRREGRDLEEYTVAAPDPAWDRDHWWITREGQKIWILETMKTVGDYLGI